jgi:uncharacterized protein with PIN domain
MPDCEPWPSVLLLISDVHHARDGRADGLHYRMRVYLRKMVVIGPEEDGARSKRGYWTSAHWATDTLGQGSQSGLANEAANGDVLPDCIALPARFNHREENTGNVSPKLIGCDSCRLGSAPYGILMAPSPDPPSGERTFTISLTFHGDLGLFLKRAERSSQVSRARSHKTSVKDVIEACGVPHPEVDLIVANGRPVDFSFPLNADSELEIYPVPAPSGLFPEFRLQAREVPGFVVDGHLGKLTRDLRLLGIDVNYRCDAEDRELLVTAVRERRALLTRDRRLLMHGVIQTGYCPRSQVAIEQTVEVIKRFDLIQKLAPFQRCLQCNEYLSPVPKETVLDKLEPLTRLYYHQFRRCPKCQQIYWRGSHHHHLASRIGAIMELVA